ncbi:MAG: TetR/AcrR family transcriptional regulator [Spirochaetota bacterium]
MSIKERKTREQQKLRTAMLEQTGRIISQEGYKAFTIRKLAKRIEYSPRTVYLYFKDKEDLLRNLVEEGFAHTLTMAEEQPQHEKPVTRLKQHLDRHIERALKQPEQYRVIVDLLSREGHKPGPNQLKVEQRLRSDLHNMHPEAASEQLEAVCDILFASLRGVCLHLIAHSRELSADALERRKEVYVNWTVDRLLLDNHCWR